MEDGGMESEWDSVGMESELDSVGIEFPFISHQFKLKVQFLFQT